MALPTAIIPQFILPVRPADTLLRNHAVVVDGDRIADVLPVMQVRDRHPDALQLPLPGHVLVPGMINMHTHSPMALLRGIADDLRLDTWLREHIWPAENRFVGRRFVTQGTELAMAEMLRAGTTCFNEMYFFPDQIAAAAEAAGMRACIGMPVIEMETPWASNAQDCFDKARDVHERILGSDLLTSSLAPHALYTVGDESLGKISELSRELDIPVYMHVLEIAWEIEHSRREYNERPLARLDRHELLGERFMAVHMAHLTDEDIEQLAATGTHVIHCPESNLKLASGVCPVAALQVSGVNVSLGTDGAASNNNLDILGELRTAALLAKGVSGDPCVLDASQALDMVTINAARALGLEKQIGSIEVGKKADLCALDLNQPETQPLNNVLSQLVYSASSRQFTHVWVNGRLLLNEGELTTIDIEKVLTDAGGWSRRLAEVA